ncbi:metal ABC transporter solute-binding protein, Zn/Mn family [Gemmatimonadota bacterium]
MSWFRAPGAILLAGMMIGVVAGCGGDRDTADDALIIAVSVQPQAWLVEQVAGDRAEVITLLSPGDSPATYQPTDAQISRVMSARLYLRTGVPFENGRWFETFEISAGPEVVDLRDGIMLHQMAHDHSHEGEGAGAGEHVDEPAGEAGSGTDPHIWVSPELLKIQAHTIADALSEVDSVNRDEYHRRLEALITELEELQTWIHGRLDEHRDRAFYVFHPAWGYFADEFGLQQKAIEIEGKDPSDHDLTLIQTGMRSDRATVIFVQPQIGSRAVEAIADAAGAEVRILDPLVRDVIANLRGVTDAIAGTFK